MSGPRFSGKIPAVGQFQAKAPFDRNIALQVLRAGVREINSIYPAGAWEWLQEHRPEVLEQCRATFRAINPAFAKEDQSGVAKAVATCIRSHRSAIDVFLKHNPPPLRVILKEEQ